MRRTIPLASALLAACATTLWPTSSVKTKSYLPDLYGCAAASARSMKYSFVSHDSTTGRFEARRPYALKAEGADPDEDARFDVLSVEIVKARNDSLGEATLKVQAGTLSRHDTKRGPTDETEYASPAVKTDAQTLITRCAST